MTNTPPPKIRVTLHSLRTPRYASGHTTVQASTIREAMAALCDADQDFANRVLAPDGKIRSSIVFCVGTRVQRNLDMQLDADSELVIISAIAGG